MKRFYLLFFLLIFNPSNLLSDMNSQTNFEEIVLAGGCFWGMEELLRKQEGVVFTEVGYAGGDESKAKYEFVKTGRTGHAEAIKVRFDNSKTNLQNILNYFFKIHDPTTLNRQGNDIGSQYRSSIFYANEAQRNIAKKIIEELDNKKVWNKKIVTSLEPLKTFTKAEDYHQSYLQKNPRGYTCHFERDFNF